LRIQLTDKAKQILESIYYNRPEIKINYQIDDKLEKQTGALGQHEIDDKTGDSIIIIDAKHITEQVITHELLHCYMYSAKYPKLRVLNFENDIINFVATHVENVIAHKIIQRKQDLLGIDTEDFNKKFAYSLGENITYEPNEFERQFKFSFKILDAEIRCKNIECNYKNAIMNKFPTSYGIFTQIYTEIINYDFYTPFEYRRAMIKILRVCENILFNNGFKIEFNRAIATEFVPSKRQLTLRVDQIFDFKPSINEFNDEKGYVLMSKSENQACYFINKVNTEEKERLAKKTLISFFDDLNIKYSVR